MDTDCDGLSEVIDIRIRRIGIRMRSDLPSLRCSSSKIFMAPKLAAPARASCPKEDWLL